MSVLACDRRGCENIMCDRFSVRYGYLCHYCFEELVELGSDADVSEFMCAVRPPKRGSEDAEAIWDREFPMDREFRT